MAVPCYTASWISHDIHHTSYGYSQRAPARGAPRTTSVALRAAQNAAAHAADSSRREMLLQLACIVASASRQEPAMASEAMACSATAHPAAAAAAAAAAVPPLLSLQTDYDRYAPTYNDLDGGVASDVLGFPELRRALLSKACGSVLELAVGSGLNLPLYNWGALTSLTALDLSQGMLNRATAAAAAAQLPSAKLALMQGDVAALPFEAGSFDCVVDTFSLCVFERPGEALREARRVVKLSGRVLLLEHTRSDLPLLGAYQDLTASAVTAMSKGCAWNQDVPQLLREAGLKPLRLEQHLGGLLALIEAVPVGEASP